MARTSEYWCASAKASMISWSAPEMLGLTSHWRQMRAVPWTAVRTGTRAYLDGLQCGQILHGLCVGLLIPRVQVGQLEQRLAECMVYLIQCVP